MSEQRLSETYRELATERTPEHLDRAVLAEAGRAARPRYSRLTTWTRPMAWAATVLLSVALVLEITRTPEPQLREVEPIGQSGDEPGRRQESVNEYRAPAPRADEQKPAALQSTAKQQFAPESSDADVIDRAEEMMRTRAADVSADAAFATTGSARMEPACDEEAIATAESWLKCIEALEAAGFTEKASEQRERLAAAFPEFAAD